MIKYSVPKMSCGGCASTIQRYLAPIPGVESIDFNLPERRLYVGGTAKTDDILKALSAAGYPAEVRHDAAA